jgi:hypothetical protein
VDIQASIEAVVDDTPVPEPATAVLLLAGALPAAVRPGRRRARRAASA